MRRKSIIGLVLCFVFSFALIVCAGCSSETDEYHPESKDPTVFSPVIGEDGVLRVGVNTDTSPLAGVSNSDISGMDVDVAAYIADDLGLKVSIVDVGSDAQGAISNGTVDIVMGIDEESDAFMNLWTSEEYLPKGIALFSLTSAGRGAPTETWGITIAAQTSSTSAWAVTNIFDEGVLVSVDNLQGAFDLLQQGEVDYVAADAIIGLYAARVQDINVTISALLSTSSGYHIGVSPDNYELQASITDALYNVTYGGIVDVIEEKWLGRVIDFDNVEQLNLGIL